MRPGLGFWLAEGKENTMFKRSLALLGAACLAAVVAAAPALAQKTKITLYTALENDGRTEVKVGQDSGG